MGKKLAIKGHPTRGKEVIALLEMLGGKNHSNIGNDDDYFYYINDKNNIEFGWTMWDNNPLYTFFTLEEFLNKYPFKVNDKVFDKADGCSGVVCEMKWDEDVSDMKYCVAFGNGIDFGWFANDSIEFCKENKNLEETQSNQDIDKVVDNFRKEFCERCGSQRCSGQDDELEYCERIKNLMENSGKPSDKNHKMGPKSKLPSKYCEDKMEEIKSNQEYDELRMPLDDDDKLATEVTIMGKRILPPDGYLVGKITQTDNGMLVEYVNKKPKYPTTYEKCCEIIGISRHDVEIDLPQTYQQKMFNLFKLCICRDAYWKIAGEQMGLDKPWEPDWNDADNKFVIQYLDNEVGFWLSRGLNYILAFPTAEMRDAFYENFKDLIEQCKELL